jgi:hypothetical protein
VKGWRACHELFRPGIGLVVGPSAMLDPAVTLLLAKVERMAAGLARLCRKFDSGRASG